ncbi:hypothetical protein [Actinomadura parmotrematis]|uniref:DUF4185 domain-containing protein n=1 Tax=Actinomadura parmotrematis TaxID=2864039 RepID=A0ABS7G2G2_9ACTN|nr:hypothetical protein [Actinomadura parmotrematis]MBW8486405.1 hypothetical protein [Actinomadura parmotrematis]
MVLRRRAWRPAAVAAACLLTLSGAGAAGADAPPPAQVRSLWETAVPGNAISRDCGYSVPVPGAVRRGLWLFCDSTWKGSATGFWLGDTAATGPYTPGRVPDALAEIPTPGAPAVPVATPAARAPAPFLPVPTGVRLPSGQSCTVPGFSYQASWISGAAPEPGPDGGGKVLLTYTDVCTTSATISTQRFGVVEYDPAANALSGQAQVFTDPAELPFQRALGSPVFAGGHLYLVGAVCDTGGPGACAAGRVVLARVGATPREWRDAAAYRWWDGAGWTADHGAAASILPGARPMAAVHAADYGALGRGFAVVEQTDITGGYRVWRSDALTGGWRVARTGTAPCGGQHGLDLCRAYIGHPELSTRDDLLMSYYDPAAAHVGVLRTPW